MQRLKRFGQYHPIDAPLVDEVKPCGYVDKIIDALGSQSGHVVATRALLRKQSPIPTSIVWNEVAPFHSRNVQTMAMYFVEIYTDTGPDFYGPFHAYEEAVAVRDRAV
jgi:hypothetical protein